MNKKILISLLYLLILAGTAHAVLRVTDLRTEQLKNPLGIDIRHPRLGWRIESDEQNVMQTAYHILVASSPELLAQGKGDCWDSGKVKTDASQWITYQGETLKRNTPYYWKVKVYTHTNETDWSEPASWSMGLLNEADWQGQWIGLDRPAPGDSETQWSRLAARYLRKEFALTKEVNLPLPITGKLSCTTRMTSPPNSKKKMPSVSSSATGASTPCARITNPTRYLLLAIPNYV